MISTSTVIVTPSVLLREGLSSLLRNTSYEVVACAARPAELPHFSSPRQQRTLALVGMDRQKENPDETAECIGLLRSLIPDGKVVLVAESSVPAKLALSSDACICNVSSRDTLIKVLKLTLMDQWVFVRGKPAATATASDSTALITSEKDNNVDATGSSPTGSHRRGTTYEAELSPRESDVLTCLAQGKSNKAIARIYNLSEATIKVHLKAILRKTTTHNRTQAAIWAITHCLQDSGTNILADAGLPPATTVPRVEYKQWAREVVGASRDDGLPPETTVSASSRL